MHSSSEHKSTVVVSLWQSMQMILDPLRGVEPQLSQNMRLKQEGWLERWGFQNYIEDSGKGTYEKMGVLTTSMLIKEAYNCASAS